MIISFLKIKYQIQIIAENFFIKYPRTCRKVIDLSPTDLLAWTSGNPGVSDHNPKTSLTVFPAGNTLLLVTAFCSPSNNLSGVPRPLGLI